MKHSIESLQAMPPSARFAAFVQWLGEQPREICYSFHDIQNCALCKFAIANGLTKEGWISADDKHISFGRGHDEWINIMPFGNYESSHSLIHSRTLGELYDRLLPLVTPPLLPTVELSEAALEALELRPLVSFERTKT